MAALFIGLWVLALLLVRAAPHSGNAIEMQLQADRAGVAQWFYDRGAGYSEAESVTAALQKGDNRVVFHLPTGTIRALRFDPINNDAHVKIVAMRWQGDGAKTLNAPGSEQLAALANIARLEHAANGIDVWPVAGSDDPQLQLPLAQPLELGSGHSPLSDGFAALLLACALALVLRLAYSRLHLQTLAVAGMALAFALIATMAGLSTTARSVHPDEGSHVPVFHYFVEHAWWPAVDDPAVVPTLSVYGASYLFDVNATYPVAARVMTPLLGWFSSEIAAARAFQCLLWLFLCFLALRRHEWALPLSVLLLSPQIWYVFSYFNNDAFSLFLAMGAVLLLCDSRGAIDAYVAGERRFTWSAFLFVLCLGLLLVSKANYLVLVPGLLLWLAIRHLGLRWRELIAVLAGLAVLGSSVFLGDVPELQSWHVKLIGEISGGALVLAATLGVMWRCLRGQTLRRPFLRLLVIAALSIGIAAPWVLQDIWVNGMPATKAARMTAVQEKYAGQGFKPSEIMQGKGTTNTALIIKGVTLKQMLFNPPYQWLQTNVLSSFGVYGYMSIFAPYGLYLLLALLTAGVALLGAIALLRSQPAQGARLLVLVVGVSALVLLSSLLMSWVYDFQPQGRYLFPIFALVALVLGQAAPKLPANLFKLMLFCALLASTYSYLCIALPSLLQAN